MAKNPPRPSSIGSKLTPRDKKTEEVRTTLTNPFGKKYGSSKEGN